MVKIALEQKELDKLNKAFKDLAKLSDKPVADLLKQEGRLMAVELAKRTDVKGNSKGVGEKHERRIRAQISNIYSDPKIWTKIISKRAGFKTGERFARLCEGKDTAGAEKVLDDLGLGMYRGKRVRVIMWDNGQAHMRVSKRRKRMNEYTVVCNYTKVNQYIKKQEKRAGNLKSGWARAAEMLRGGKGSPTRGIPNWAKGKARNHDNRGIGRVNGSKNKKVLFLANLYEDAGKLSDHTYGAGAVKTRVAKIKVRIEKEIKHELKRLKRKYK
tara:strand:- start:77 stop:889 length:813 start_codon:yes stop_codon:yes gene_type:complete